MTEMVYFNKTNAPVKLQCISRVIVTFHLSQIMSFSTGGMVTFKH